MSTIQRGDVVILSLGGKDYNALVHQVCRTEASHLGANQEPTLHLSYVPDDPMVNGKPKVQQPGYIPESVMIYDVVHASHKFSREYMKDHSLREVQEHDLHRTMAEAEIRNRRGAGEWMFLWERLPQAPAGMTRPTIAELEQILNSPEQPDVIVNPDGSLDTRPKE